MTKRNLLSCLVLAALWTAFAGRAVATVYYADTSTGSDDYDGLAAAWGGIHGPKLTIQAAINAAASGDTVIVAQGTYYEQVSFNGRNITVRSTDPTSAEVVATTVINGGGSWETWESGLAVTFASGETAAAVLDGFTVTTVAGSGIRCTNASSPSIRRNVIRVLTTR
jgi:hypothetical protein